MIADHTKGANLVIEAYQKYLEDGESEIDGLLTEFWAKGPLPCADKEFWGFIKDTGTSYDIAIRGTTTFEDWLDNAELSEGWTAIFHQFGERIVNVISAAPPEYTINIYAHSAGCCIAKRLNRASIRPTKLVLFAPPNDDIEVSDCISYINTADIVPKSPIMWGYAQSGRIVKFIDNRGSLIKNHAIETYRDNIDAKS
jgi:hypothetical protein